MSKKSISKELLFIFSLLLNSITFNLIMKANFGLSCMSSLPYVLNQLTDLVSIGMINFIVQTATLIVMMLITKKFSLYYALSFVVGFIFGALADLWFPIFNSLPDTLICRIILFVVGWVGMVITLVGFVRCDMPLMPFDIVVRDIAKVKSVNTGKIKMIFDIIFTCLGLILSTVFLGKIVGIGISTIFQAIFTGKLESVLLKLFDDRFVPETKTKVGDFFCKIKAL